MAASLYTGAGSEEGVPAIVYASLLQSLSFLKMLVQRETDHVERRSFLC